jgi:hypothetical protein
VEEVNSSAQSGCKFIWRELLSSDEIKTWVVDRSSPLRLRKGELSFPGIYRFIFPEKVDGTALHTPFYVGEGGDLGKRLKDHFRRASKKEKHSSKGIIMLTSGSQVRGSIENSQGDFSLQILVVEKPINVCGVILNQHSFDCSFSRKLLENLAILHSQRFDKFMQLNRGVSQGTKNFLTASRKPKTV